MKYPHMLDGQYDILNNKRGAVHPGSLRHSVVPPAKDEAGYTATPGGTTVGGLRSGVHQPYRRPSLLPHRIQLLQASHREDWLSCAWFHHLRHAMAAFTLDVYGHVTPQMRRDSASRMEGII